MLLTVVTRGGHPPGKPQVDQVGTQPPGFLEIDDYEIYNINPVRFMTDSYRNAR
jgi:hypothetical protein